MILILSESKKPAMYVCIHDESVNTAGSQMALDSFPTARFNAQQ
jgi:hypothetical protein